MSQWTHVNGSIRIDHLIFSGEKPKLKFGNPFGYGKEPNGKDFIPYGSEGSLKYKEVITGHWDKYGGTANYASYVFWGDLRDYDDEQELIKYFRDSTKHLDIRSGIIEIEVEGKQMTIMQYNDGEWKVLKTDKRKYNFE